MDNYYLSWETVFISFGIHEACHIHLILGQLCMLQIKLRQLLECGDLCEELGSALKCSEEALRTE